MSGIIPSFETFNGDDLQDTFEIPFNYRSKSEVTVTRDGEDEIGFTFTDPSHILLASPLLTGEVLVIQRVTDLSEPAVKFRNSSGWTGGQLNAMVDQLLFSVQEARDTADRGLFIDITGGYNFEGRQAKNLGAPSADGDAVTKLWAQTSMTSTLGEAIAAKNSAENSEATVTTLHGDVDGWNSNVNLKHSDVQGWHGDVDGWNSNVNLKHSDVQGWHGDVDRWHTDVQAWRSEVSTNKTLTLGYRNEAEGFRNEAEQFKNDAYLQYETRVEVETASIPILIQYFRSAGYAEAGDGGGALYRRVASEPSHAGKVQSADGAWWELAAQPINILMFGATTAATDCRAEIQAAWDYVSSLGGGDLRVPRGSYTVAALAGSNAIMASSNVRLIGEGPEVSEIKLADAADAHLIQLTDVVNVAFAGITLNGNRATQTVGVHVIRGSNADQIRIEDDVVIKEAAMYGLGFQVGTFRDIYIGACRIFNTGGDGIDFKNSNNNNRNIFINGTEVANFGLSASYVTQAGIDIRGPARIVGPNIRGFPDDGTGVRFRFGESDEPGGIGGHEAVVMGANIVGPDAATGVGYGINVGGRNVRVVGNVITSVFVGIEVIGRNALISNNTILQSFIGVNLNDAGGVIDGARPTLQGNYVDTSVVSAVGIRVRPGIAYALLDGNQIRNASVGIEIQAGATFARLLGNVLTNCATSVTDAGSSTSARANEGWVTEAYIETGSLDLASTGTRAATVAHGLAVTPLLRHCSVSLIRETAVTDPTFAFVWLEVADANNIVVRARITGASATAGATFRMGIAINARP